MPLEPFAIFQITEGMILQDEPMGSKDKVWCQLPAELGDGHWLFKQPRQQEENIEHLAEKIAHEMAALIQLPCARVELAEFDGVRGSISLDVRTAGDVLVHGNEIIAGRVLGYDLHKKRHTSDHTFERIRQAILEVCGSRCEEDLGQFAGYLVFEAMIGKLVNRLATQMPDFFGPWLRRVERVTDEQIVCMVERIPAGWISAAQREFASALMREARDQLVQIKLS